MQRRFLVGALAAAALAAAAAGSILLTGCGEKRDNAGILGVTAGSSEQIAEVEVKTAAKTGLTIKVKTFGDYIAVDTALAQGDIDLNAFQHQPYLDNFNAKNNTNLVPIAKTYLAPIAGYSKKYERVEDVPDGATVTVPNDPTNEGRALCKQLLTKVRSFIVVDSNTKRNRGWQLRRFFCLTCLQVMFGSRFWQFNGGPHLWEGPFSAVSRSAACPSA